MLAVMRDELCSFSIAETLSVSALIIELKFPSCSEVFSLILLMAPAIGFGLKALPSIISPSRYSALGARDVAKFFGCSE